MTRRAIRPSADRRCNCCRPTSNLHVEAPSGPATRVLRRAREITVHVYLGEGEAAVFGVTKTEMLRALAWKWKRNPGLRVSLMLVPAGHVCVGRSA